MNFYSLIIYLLEVDDKSFFILIRQRLTRLLVNEYIFFRKEQEKIPLKGLLSFSIIEVENTKTFWSAVATNCGPRKSFFNSFEPSFL